MINELDKKMSPFNDTSQALADRVAETLNLMHDFPPITPTKKSITAKMKNEEYDNTKERDISMLTNIPRNMVLVGAYGKALDVAEPCEARSAFMEQIYRLSSSVKGWRIDKAIEGMKAVRPVSEEEKTKSRFGRFADWMKGR